MSLIDYKKDFPWFENNKGVVYLDNAATTLKPSCMIEAAKYYYTNLSANPHSDNKLAVQVYDQIQNTRKLLADFIDADQSEVMFTSGATEGINTVANALQDIINEDDEVIVTYLEHAANLLPWYRLKERTGCKLILTGKDQLFTDSKEFLKLLTPKTKVVSLTAASNLLAIEINVKKIIADIKAYNPTIFVCLDATQFIEHYSLKCHEFNCDFAVASAHKMCGPTGCGFLYLKNPLAKELNPLKYGGDMNEDIEIDGFKFAQGNHKWEGGTPNAAGLFAWKESLEYLNKIGNKAIREREVQLKTYFMQKMPKREDLVIFNPELDVPLITFNFKNKNGKFISTDQIEKYLADNNILARSGLSDADLAKYPMHVNSVVRVSMLFYNDFNDLDKLIEVLSKYQVPND